MSYEKYTDSLTTYHNREEKWQFAYKKKSLEGIWQAFHYLHFLQIHEFIRYDTIIRQNLVYSWVRKKDRCPFKEPKCHQYQNVATSPDSGALDAGGSRGAPLMSGRRTWGTWTKELTLKYEPCLWCFRKKGSRGSTPCLDGEVGYSEHGVWKQWGQGEHPSCLNREMGYSETRSYP